MRWAAAITLLFHTSPVWSQTVPTLRSDTRAVQIDVVATDGQGRPVSIGAAYATDILLKENAAALQVFVRDIASGRIGSRTVSLTTLK